MFFKKKPKEEPLDPLVASYIEQLKQAEEKWKNRTQDSRGKDESAKPLILTIQEMEEAIKSAPSYKKRKSKTIGSDYTSDVIV